MTTDHIVPSRLEGSPHGRKATALHDEGWNVIAPSLPRTTSRSSSDRPSGNGADPAEPDLGSSRGGASP